MLTGLPIMLLAYPEIFLLAAGCAILVIDLFLAQDSRWVTYVLCLATLLGCALLTLIVAAKTGGGHHHIFHGSIVFRKLASPHHMFTYTSGSRLLVVSPRFICARGA